MESLIKRLDYLYEQIPTLEGERGQIGLVKASGASKSVVNQWLAGLIKSIDIKYALAIEESLGVSHIWLMMGKGPFRIGERETPAPTEVQRPLMTIATIEELDLLDLFRLADDRGRSAILRAARSAKKRPAVELLRDQK